MTKQEVVALIKETQEIVLAQRYEDGVIEVYEYVEKPFYVGRVNPNYWKSYWLIFLDGRLERWERADKVNAEKMRARLAESQLAIQAIDAIKGTYILPTHQNININK